MNDALVAGCVGSLLAGVPSTTWALVRGDDVLDGARAAGAIVLRDEQRTAVLLAAAVPVHLALSVGWGAVLAAILPRGREPAAGVAAGLGIAALDLGVIGRRIPAIRALRQPPQWADHVAYGLAVGVTLRVRRRGDGRRSAREHADAAGGERPCPRRSLTAGSCSRAFRALLDRSGRGYPRRPRAAPPPPAVGHTV